jgi:two-component system, chemotaxis family, protein-glutamate methylesterase/glutaminase
MRKIRVLIVDDSVVFRVLLSKLLGTDGGIEVTGRAENGQVALKKIAHSVPDIVTLDVDMPVLDGLETLAEIRKLYPTLPVIMLSATTASGAADTLEALQRGASDYVVKPSESNGGSARLIEELIPKINALGRPPAPASETTRTAPVLRSTGVHRRISIGKGSEVYAVALGVSTGGPNALAALLPSLPSDLATPVLVVQHMPPMFTRILAERLNREAKAHVVEAHDGQRVEPGTVYIAPGDFHMEVCGSPGSAVLRMNRNPKEHSVRPAVDVLFRSVANVYGSNALGVVLTGMGKDGLAGCEVLAEKGCPIITQDEATSVVWGMPGFVTQAGLATKTLPLSLIGPEISRRVGRNGAESTLALRGRHSA